MPKVLMLGAGPLQLPAIKSAKAAGWHVICADWNSNAPGFAIADERSITSTLDANAIVELARSKQVDRVITSTSDAPVRIASYACERLGLPCGISYEDAVCATQKDAMRSRLSEHGIPMPDFTACASYFDFSDAIRSFGWECVVKPADSSASRGVEFICGEMNESDLQALYETIMAHSRKGVAMVEERARGAEVSVEAMTIGGVTEILAITDKLVTDPPFFVELGHSEPSQLASQTLEEIRRLATRTIGAIGIVDGPSHTEIMVTERGPVVIETAARLGGDYITSKLVPFSTGIDMVDISVRLALGLNIELNRSCSRGAAIRFLTADKSGTLESITIDPAINDICGLEEIDLYMNPGNLIDVPHSSNDRAGHVICTGRTAHDACHALNAAMECIDVCVA